MVQTPWDALAIKWMQYLLWITNYGNENSKYLLNRIEQHTPKIANDCFNTNIYSYLETSGGQSLYQYLNAIHFCNTSDI
jgi:hypothetical protein